MCQRFHFIDHAALLTVLFRVQRSSPKLRNDSKKEAFTKLNRKGMSQNHMGMLQILYMGTPQNHKGKPQNHIGVPQNHIGAPQNLIGMPQNYIGTSQNPISFFRHHSVEPSCYIQLFFFGSNT